MKRARAQQEVDRAQIPSRERSIAIDNEEASEWKRFPKQIIQFKSQLKLHCAI